MFKNQNSKRHLPEETNATFASSFRSFGFRILKLFRISIFGLLVFCVASAVRAEYRVALLIGNRDYKDQPAAAGQDLQTVARGLEKYGFRCQVVEDVPNDKAIRDAIEGFATTTPVRSTALLLYQGRITDGPSLLATDSRGRYALDRAIESLSSRGGSLRNLVFIDSPDAVSFPGDLPAGVQLTFGKAEPLMKKLDGKVDLIAALAAAGKSQSTLAHGETLTGVGSQAISPPDRFVHGKRAGDEWVNRRGMVYCWCPPGSYTAGSPPETPGRYADEQQRPVTIADGFWISKYELTHAQWMGANVPRGALASHKLHPQDMANQSKDGGRMLKALNDTDPLPAPWQYALPSEEQWEYAARAGTSTRFFFGDDVELLPRFANFGDKSYFDTKDIYSISAHRTLDDGFAQLAPVGSFAANPWGLHDMYGNLAEWCSSAATRGGSWVSSAEICRSAYRHKFGDRDSSIFIGFRLIIQRKK